MPQNLPTIPPFIVGLLRALGVILLVAIVKFFANSADLTPFLGNSTAAIVSMLALGIEHMVEQSTGTALFGAIRTRPSSQG